VDRRVEGRYAVLTGAEAHHLTNVMRARPGDRVTLFDGTGVEFSAEVAGVRRGQVELLVLEARQVDRELPFPLTLAVALPKGQRQHWLVEKAVELGVSRLVPLVCARGVAQPTQRSLNRLQRAVIEASKQCGRNRLMEIAPPQQCSLFCQSADHTALRLMAHPQPQSLAECAASGVGLKDAGGPMPSEDTGNPMPQAEASSAQGFILAVGPEGGFTEDEVAVARQQGWRIVSLGKRTLRVETACLMLVCWALAAAGAAVSLH
jgi:16S rRNA (uracil1498-N3)-methyltransferase